MEGLRGEELRMFISFSRTMESPCRTCENIHLNKEECSKDCVRLKTFQEAILHYDERTIKNFGIKFDISKD